MDGKKLRFSSMMPAVLMLVILCALSGRANAQQQGVVGFFSGGTTSSVGSDHTIGWSFTLLNPITVTHLGIWDDFGNGTVQVHDVGIWLATGTNPIVQATVTAGSSVLGADGTNYWRWAALATPVTLLPGQYVIGGYYDSDLPRDRFLRGIAGSPLTAVFGPGVVFGQSLRTPGSTLLKPNVYDPDSDQGRFGPNFLYTPVPEPALLQLPFLVGLGGFGLWWRRRNTA